MKKLNQGQIKLIELYYSNEDIDFFIREEIEQSLINDFYNVYSEDLEVKIKLTKDMKKILLSILRDLIRENTNKLNFKSKLYDAISESLNLKKDDYLFNYVKNKK